MTILLPWMLPSRGIHRSIFTTHQITSNLICKEPVSTFPKGKYIEALSIRAVIADKVEKLSCIKRKIFLGSEKQHFSLAVINFQFIEKCSLHDCILRVYYFL